MNKKMISLEISDELREALRREAFLRNKNMSALIRDILEEHIANMELEVSGGTYGNRITK